MLFSIAVIAFQLNKGNKVLINKHHFFIILMSKASLNTKLKAYNSQISLFSKKTKASQYKTVNNSQITMRKLKKSKTTNANFLIRTKINQKIVIGLRR